MVARQLQQNEHTPAKSKPNIEKCTLEYIFGDSYRCLSGWITGAREKNNPVMGRDGLTLFFLNLRYFGRKFHFPVVTNLA